MKVIGIVAWLPFAVFRFVLWVLGWVVVPFTLIGDGADNTPRMWRWFGNAADVPASHSKNRWTKYVWMAWRNPLEGLDSKLKQPIPEKHPNPDALVRNEGMKSASRYMSHGIFWEYWYMRRIDIGKYPWFEFRIGWKFVDGNEDFVPTFQLGPRSS